MRNLSLVLLTLLAGCGDADLSKTVKATDGLDGKDGESCVITDTDDGGVLLTCGSVSKRIDQVASCKIDQSAGFLTFTCPGQDPVRVPVGNASGDNPAQSGARGPQGPAGRDGVSCDIEVDDNGCIWSVCGDKKKLLWVPGRGVNR